jgi:Transposase DDE domain
LLALLLAPISITVSSTCSLHEPNCRVLRHHPASIQDRDGGGSLLRVSRRIFPFIRRVFADSGYAGERVAKATLIAVEIVRKNPDQVGFAVNPRRWVVERFFAWIGRNRRLAKDFEATIDSARAFLYAASVMLLVRRPFPFSMPETSIQRPLPI